jgi:type IV secretory pathway TrbD component
MERTPAKLLMLADVLILFQFDLISSIVAFNRYSALVILIMLLINIAIIYLLRQMAKYDTQLLEVYLRSKRYQNYYSARSSYANNHVRKGNLIFKPINWKG